MRKPIALFFLLVVAWVPSVRAADPPRPRSAYDYLRRNRVIRFPHHRPAVRRAPPPPDTAVGDTRAFWSWDLGQMPPHDVQVPSTCRAVGAHVYVFVADDQWQTHVTQQDVDAVLEALESSSPAGSIDPGLGIVPNEIEVFGPIPDALDADPRVFVLLMELDKYGGTQFDGFFNPFNQYPDEETVAEYGYHSNECEMITVNSAIRPPASEMTLSIFAHELQHLIHWGGDPDEIAWVDESCAEAAMVICGYLTDIDWLDDYLARPATPLYETEHVHYGACMLFGSHLFERFGAGFLRSLVADPAHGEAGFAIPLQATDHTGGMPALLCDWATATAGDALGATDPRLGHPLLEVGLPAMAHQVDDYPAAALTGSLDESGAAYVALEAPAGADLQVEVASDPPGRIQWRALLDTDEEPVAIDPEGGTLRIGFSAHPGAGATLVLVAHGGDAGYTVTLEEIEVGQDGGTDAGHDDGAPPDAGLDGGHDAGADAGADAGHDAGVDAAREAGADPGPADGGSGGCGCSGGRRTGAHPPAIGWLLLAGLAVLRRRAG